jgi:hypoxanthine-guanine phosphoribosyltransferase
MRQGKRKTAEQIANYLWESANKMVMLLTGIENAQPFAAFLIREFHQYLVADFCNINCYQDGVARRVFVTGYDRSSPKCCSTALL